METKIHALPQGSYFVHVPEITVTTQVDRLKAVRIKRILRHPSILLYILQKKGSGILPLI
ncbi:MAG: hypothetical protein B1H11_12015 [Desulfobacteraceae bacterium 4484_190.1]|nr:MAG: hypothetical protein B1H11_12015 [Desulfobacteraceae bacterium 4484_190.1]